MSGKAANVPLTEKQQEVLTKISRSTTVAQRLAQRVRVIFSVDLNGSVASTGPAQDLCETFADLRNRDGWCPFFFPALPPQPRTMWQSTKA